MKLNRIIFVVSFGFLMSTIATGCATTTIEGAKARAVTLSRLKTEGESFVKKGLESDEGLIVLIQKGESVKLNLAGNLGFAKVAPGENSVEFLQDIYIYVSKKNMMISPDGVRFTPIHKGKAVKKLFGKKQGTFSLGFGITKEEGATISAAAGWQ
jgi:hypothetical protein